MSKFYIFCAILYKFYYVSLLYCRYESNALILTYWHYRYCHEIYVTSLPNCYYKKVIVTALQITRIFHSCEENV